MINQTARSSWCVLGALSEEYTVSKLQQNFLFQIVLLHFHLYSLELWDNMFLHRPVFSKKELWNKFFTGAVGPGVCGGGKGNVYVRCNGKVSGPITTKEKEMCTSFRLWVLSCYYHHCFTFLFEIQPNHHNQPTSDESEAL